MFSYCAYQGCPNQNVPCSSLTFFTLPKDERRKIWLKNSGNPEIQNLSDKTIKYFCENHFDPKYIRRQFSRTTLHKSAVPYKYDDSQSAENLRNNTTESVEYFVSDNDVSSNNSDDVPSNTRKYEFVIESDEQNSSSSTRNENEEKNSNFKTVNLKSGKYIIKEILSRNHMKRKAQDDDSNDANYQKQSKVINNEYLNKRKTSDDADYDDDDNQRESKNEICEKGEIENIELITENITDNFSDMREDDCVYLITEDETSVIKDGSKTCHKVTENNGLNEVKQSSNLHCSLKNNNDKQETLSNSNEYEEDKHFALSLVGYFQRLPHQKKALAKLKILQYLTELEFNGKANL